MVVVLLRGRVLDDDAVDLIGQEDVVSQSDPSLQMPLGMRDDQVAPLLTGIHVDALLEGRAAVAERGQAGGH